MLVNHCSTSSSSQAASGSGHFFYSNLKNIYSSLRVFARQKPSLRNEECSGSTTAPLFLFLFLPILVVVVLLLLLLVDHANSTLPSVLLLRRR